MMKRQFPGLFPTVVVTTCAVAIAASPATTQSVVTVTMKPADVRQRSFDPDKPPDGLPLDPAVEAACAAALFSCHCDVDFVVTTERPTATGTEVTAEIKAIRITLCLDETLWLPEQASAKLVAHEKGHATISKAFFAKAQNPVEQAAALLIGQKIVAEGADHRSAAEAAIQEVTKNVARVYTQQTTTASLPVQQTYDQLTDHSRNKVPEDKAIQLAMKHAMEPAQNEMAK